jgi:hypothetical protein
MIGGQTIESSTVTYYRTQGTCVYKIHYRRVACSYARPPKFREKLEGWFKLVRSMWPESPAHIDHDGIALVVDRSLAVLPTITTLSSSEGRVPAGSAAVATPEEAADSRGRPRGEAATKNVSIFRPDRDNQAPKARFSGSPPHLATRAAKYSSVFAYAVSGMKREMTSL